LNGIELDPTKTNSTWSEQRSPGRYELLSPMAPPFTSEELLRNPLLLPLVERALGTNRIEVDTHSSVTSLGNTPAQHWHRDAGFIFKNQVKEQLPPHGLVVFIPLIDVTKSMGPTNFLTGSHIQCKPRDEKEINLANWILKECPFVGPSVQTPAPKGSAIVFDMRILHRGLANKKPIRRPQLYVTFFQEWFVDHVNFNAKQSSQFDMLPKKARKMLSRVDTKQYVLDLENKLKDMGIDVTELQSSYDYKKNSFSAAANDV
jgi:ectoine hydroxylase-related dioxygenase (phytanoyl-CoA dioxygenase family)